MSFLPWNCLLSLSPYLVLSCIVLISCFWVSICILFRFLLLNPLHFWNFKFKYNICQNFSDLLHSYLCSMPKHWVQLNRVNTLSLRHWVSCPTHSKLYNFFFHEITSQLISSCKQVATKHLDKTIFLTSPNKVLSTRVELDLQSRLHQKWL